MGEYIGFFVGVLTVVVIILLFYALGLINVGVANGFNQIFCSTCNCNPEN